MSIPAPSASARTRRPLRPFQSDSSLPPTSSHAAGQRYGIDEGLTNRLMGMGMNVRKNVSQGYKTAPIPSLPTGPMQPPTSNPYLTTQIPAFTHTSTYASSSTSPSASSSTSPSPDPNPNTFPPIFLTSSEALLTAHTTLERDRALALAARRLKPWKSETREERARRGRGREVRAMGDVGFGDEDEDGMDEMEADDAIRMGMGVTGGQDGTSGGFAMGSLPSSSTSFIGSEEESYFSETRGTKRSSRASRTGHTTGRDEEEDEGEATDVDEDEENNSDSPMRTLHKSSQSFDHTSSALQQPSQAQSRPTRRMPLRSPPALSRDASGGGEMISIGGRTRPGLGASKSLPHPAGMGSGFDMDVDMDGEESGNVQGGDLRKWVGRTDF